MPKKPKQKDIHPPKKCTPGANQRTHSSRLKSDEVETISMSPGRSRATWVHELLQAYYMHAAVGYVPGSHHLTISPTLTMQCRKQIVHDLVVEDPDRCSRNAVRQLTGG